MLARSCRSAKFLLAGFLTVFLGAAAPSVPDTPATRQFIAWLDAFNTGDAVALGEYLRSNYPSSRLTPQQWMRFYRDSAGYDLVRVEEVTATRVIALAKFRRWDGYIRITFTIGSEAPYPMTAFQGLLVQRPAEIPPVAPMTEQQAIAAFRTSLEAASADGAFSGAVLIARNGRPVFTAAYGLADRVTQTPNTAETKFRIGSMNKMFTAVAVMQLVQAGKIALADPIGRYLTDYPNPDVASKVTIEHLLSHTGGTGDIFGPQFAAQRTELRELADYFRLYGNRAPSYEPGSKWEYSNYGYILLGLLIEKVSGENYYDYVRAHIFEPAGMMQTDSLPEAVSVPGRSIGYSRSASGELESNAGTLPYRGTSAGGGYSTVGDLVRFAEALTSYRLLDRQTTDLATAGKQSVFGDAYYAFGFDDRTEGGVRSFGHGGGAPGMNGELRIFPKSGYVVVVLSNFDPPLAQFAAGYVGRRLPAE
jgi:CubicO group peptidase (beta-lactamase class C family)